MTDHDKTGKYPPIARVSPVDPAARVVERLEDAAAYALQLDVGLAQQVDALLTLARRYVGEAA